MAVREVDMIDRKRRAGEAAERMAMEAMVDSAESTSHLEGCDNFEYTLTSATK